MRARSRSGTPRRDTQATVSCAASILSCWLLLSACGGGRVTLPTDSTATQVPTIVAASSSLASSPTPQPTMVLGDTDRIVYVGSDGNVWTVRSDGTEQMPVTSGGGASSPRWSPDGRSIAYVSPVLDNVRRGSNVVIIAADGSEPRVVFSYAGQKDNNGPQYVRSVDWLADGRLLVGLSITRGGAGDYACVVSPSSPELLYEQQCSFSLPEIRSSFRTTTGGLIAFTAWSPDPRYSITLGARTKVAVAMKRSANEAAQRIARLPDTTSDPVVVPSDDAARFAYVVDDGVHVVNADGTGDRVVYPDGAPGGLAWSPHGDAILFSTQTRTVPGDLMMLSVDSAQAPRNLTQGADPDWIKADEASAASSSSGSQLPVRTSPATVGSASTIFSGDCITFTYPANWTISNHSRHPTGLGDGRTAKQELVIISNPEWSVPTTPGGVKIDFQLLAPAPIVKPDTRIPVDEAEVIVDGVQAAFSIFEDPLGGFVGSSRLDTPSLHFSVAVFGASAEDVRIAMPIISTVHLCGSLS